MVGPPQYYWSQAKSPISALETTAHTLAAIIAFLALHDNPQGDIYHQIMSVVGDERDPVYHFNLPCHSSHHRLGI